jgi:hypothetical protein
MALRFTIIDQFGNNTIIDEPVGWDGINLHYIRHKEWHGFIDAIDDTLGGLQFYGSGYDILKAAYSGYGVEAQCGFLVQYQCTDDASSWDTIYQGQFTFYEYKEVQGLNGCHIECSVESITNVMVLKNRYEQKVDLNSLISFQSLTGPQTSTLIPIQAISTTLADPPNSGVEDINQGDTYLVPAGANTWTGGSSGEIAVWSSDANAWTYSNPQTGQILTDLSTHTTYVYNGSAWVAYTGQMPQYDALGGQIVMPSKTIPLATAANVDPAPYADPANTIYAASSGGSSFTVNNAYDYGCGHATQGLTYYLSDPAQGTYSMELSWIGGVLTQDVPSFVGANSNLRIGVGISGTDPAPIYTYSPDAGLIAPAVNISINIIGTISALEDPAITNYSGNPVQVSGMQAALCYGTGSFGNAFSSATGNVYGANTTSPLILSATETWVGGPPIEFTYSYVGPVPMISGTNVYLVFQFDFTGRCYWDIGGNKQGDPQICTIAFSGKASFEVDSNFPNTAAPVYMINEGLSRVTEAISGENIRVYSDFFGRTDSQPYNTLNNNPGGLAIAQPNIGHNNDGEGGLLCITNGLLIRGQTLLDGSRPPMPVSLKQLYEALNAVYNIGMTVEPDPTNAHPYWLRVEPMAFFYKSHVIMTCDNVNEVTTSNEADKYIGIFRTGYSKWQGEQTGGLDDFMNKREYRTALSTSSKVLEKYCNFLGSSYAIETTRRQTGISSQDWRFDHENFLICLERSTQNNAGGTGVAGLAIPSTDIAGALLEIVVISGGSGYTIPPSVIIDAPTSPTIAFGGIQATAIAFVTNGVVSSIQITNQGNGYPSGTAVYVNFGAPVAQAMQVEQNALNSITDPITLTTMVDPKSLYNYRISPIRNAMRWVKSIFQSYSNWMGGVLHFVSGEANIKATGEYEGITGVVPVIENALLAEDSDISYSNFATATISDYYPLYGNLSVGFSYPLSYAQWLTITANPYGLIAYTVNDGSTQYGWIDELKYSPFEGTAEFKLKKMVPVMGGWPVVS